jgi:hypothetical protein
MVFTGLICTGAPLGEVVDNQSSEVSPGAIAIDLLLTAGPADGGRASTVRAG